MTDSPDTTPRPPTPAGAHRRWLVQVGVLVLVLGAGLSMVSRALFIEPVFDAPDLRLGEPVRTLIIGASHGACAFDPAAFTGPVFGETESVARHGELVFFTRHKLRALLDANPQVTMLIMAFAPIHLAEWQDRELFDGTAASRSHFMNYFMLVDEAGRAELDAWSADYVLASLKYGGGFPLGYMADAVLYLHHLRGTLTPDHYPFFGGYTGLDGSHLKPRLTQAILRKYFERDGEVAGESELALESLWGVLELAKARGLRLVLVNTPVHADFRAGVPESFRVHYDEVVERIRREFPFVLFLDQEALDLPDDQYLDADHLNRAGGQRFSIEMAGRIRRAYERR